MTALHLVPTPDADLDALEHAVEAGLTAAVASLTRLRELDAHTRRGFTLWHEYLTATFGDLLALLKLPEGEMRALVESMSTPTAEHRKGLPVRAQAALAGVAPGTVMQHRRALGLVVEKAKPEPQPAPTGKKYEQALEWLRRSPDGLTLEELTRKTGWREGSASGALSYLLERHLAVRSELRRANQRIHYATEAGQ